jgi:VIT1/CCC1 family predicted Fe2+/Mn2+ transporter
MAVHAVEMKEIPASKVVPLSVFTQEEQLRSTETGTMAMKLSRPKSMLPVSDQVKIPEASNTQLDALLEQIAHIRAMSDEQKAELANKVRTALADISKEAAKLHALMKDSKAPTPKDGTKFDPWNQSIMMAYTAFAENQMNQNDLIMNGWIAQQAAQNNSLQDAAAGEAAIAKQSTDSRSASASKCSLWGIAAFVGVLLLGVTIAAFSGGTATPLVVGLVLGVAALAGLGTGLGTYAGFSSSSSAASGDTAGNWTSEGPDQALLTEINSKNTFWGMISQKTNNQISSGSQTDVVNSSSSNTSLGQQASQVIQAMGQAMQTRVNG